MKFDPRSSYYNTEKERLLREIAQREAQLNALNASVQNTPERMISESLARKQKFSDKSYIKFLISTLKESRLYALWERLLKYFRRFRLLTTILQIIGYVITLISTGAFFISILSVIIIALPFALAATLGGLIASLWNRRRIIRYFRKENTIASITIIFMPVSPADQSTGTFLTRTAHKIADKGDSVFIVKPLNSKYKSKSKSNKVYFINQSDYFYFNKRLFTDCKSITHIHL